MKRDPHKNKERYLKWKDTIGSIIPDLTNINSQLVLQYLNDIEIGTNVALGSKKGARSYIRLNNLKQRLIFLIKHFQIIYRGVIDNMGFNPTSPYYSGDGIAIWKAKDKNNKTYLKVKVLRGTSINCFQVEEKKD